MQLSFGLKENFRLLKFGILFGFSRFSTFFRVSMFSQFNLILFNFLRFPSSLGL